MEKITKLIRSALNNTSANEASQALKMAANLMQSNGINPSEYLLSKDDSLDEEHVRNLNMLISQLEAENEYLANRLNAMSSKGSQEELREAKEVAIKWHRRAEALEEESKEFARSSVRSANEASYLESALNKKNTHFLYASVIAAVECFIIFALR
ncbi:DUF2786 domain-containing protein [Serratia marcescens]|uniref:DUF2786 domain-containing protein n=1 Tax=Serratia marcescens TaxID=615 RepID=UPI0011C9139A|nr:DUF2786 domain-containing protein [Serratia marcescens]TXE41400.1 DUF2786 domain-containing protein [Serratia marcescens]